MGCREIIQIPTKGRYRRLCHIVYNAGVKDGFEDGMEEATKYTVNGMFNEDGVFVFDEEVDSDVRED